MPKLRSPLLTMPLYEGTPDGAPDPHLPAGTEYLIIREIPCPSTAPKVPCIEIEVQGWRLLAVQDDKRYRLVTIVL